MESKRRKKKPAVPFYKGLEVDPEAVHERVIQGVRESVRSLATSRPFTPADTNRSLFGISGGLTPFGDALSDRPLVDRPASAYPYFILFLIYLHNYVSQIYLQSHFHHPLTHDFVSILRISRVLSLSLFFLSVAVAGSFSFLSRYM